MPELLPLMIASSALRAILGEFFAIHKQLIMLF